MFSSVLIAAGGVVDVDGCKGGGGDNDVVLLFFFIKDKEEPGMPFSIFGNVCTSGPGGKDPVVILITESATESGDVDGSAFFCFVLLTQSKSMLFCESEICFKAAVVPCTGVVNGGCGCDGTGAAAGALSSNDAISDCDLNT